MSTDTAEYQAELEAISQVIARVESSKKGKDPDEFLALFAPTRSGLRIMARF